MKSIDLTEGDHARVMLLARAWEVSEGEAVRRLLDKFVEEPSSSPAEPDETDSTVAVYADYEGQHIEAVYQQATKRMTITSGVLRGQSYKSPSGAAIAVVRALNPNVHPNRNGWNFWFIAENGHALGSIRPQ